MATIFSRMGDGKNTGKLLFKKVFSDTGFDISDGDASMTFSTTVGGGSSIITLNEIAFGTGTGITSSPNFVVNTTLYGEAIYKFNSIRQDPDISKASYVQSGCRNFAIGGNSNFIYGPKDSVIVGGYTNSIVNSGRSSIVAGRKNSIKYCGYTSQHNTILSSESSYTKDSMFSTILSSQNSCIILNKHSAIVSANNNSIESKFLNHSYNDQNLIVSGENNLIYNKGTLELPNSLKFNTVMSSDTSCIILSSTGSGTNGSVYSFNGSEVSNNTILSSKCSSILNCQSYDGCVTNNLIFSGRNNITFQKFSTISGRFNKTNNLDLVSKPATLGLYSQILSSNRSYIHTCMSSIISSIGSTSSAGLDTECTSRHNNIIGGSYHCTRCVYSTGFYYSSILGGRKNCFLSGNSPIYKREDLVQEYTPGTVMSNLIAGECNIGNGLSIIIGGNYNRVSTNPSTKLFGLTQGAIDGGNRRVFRDGIILGGTRNFAGGYSIVLGGDSNYAPKRSVIIGGSNNWAAFQYKPSYTQYSTWIGMGPNPRSFRGVTYVSQDFIIGGSKNCATSGFSSIIIGGCCNVTRNANDTSIIGGCCNFIESHGDFSGKEQSITGITFSEAYALFSLAQFYKPSFTPPTNIGWIGDVSYLRSKANSITCVGPYQTQVNNNFIIGGHCNFFGSNFTNSYANNSTYDFFGIYGTFSGLSKRATSFVLNSGIVGGSCNSIINKYNLWDATGLYCGTLVNSVILGGTGLTVSKSNMVCTKNAIFADTLQVKDTSKVGFTGFVNNPSSIVICNGLIISVT